MNIQPIGERVCLKVLPAEEKTSSGLLIPATAQEKTNQGEIVALGDSQEIKVKIGQKVIYDKYAGTQVKIDGEDHLILKMSDIIAVID